MVTPYKFCVATLIRSYCNFKISEEMENLSTYQKTQIRKSFSLLCIRLLQGPDLKLIELRNLFNNYKSLGPLLEKFVEALENISENNIDYFSNEFKTLKFIMCEDTNSVKLPTKCTLAWKNCIVGFFLRRIRIEFLRMNFSEVIGLFESFQRYYNEWIDTISISLSKPRTRTNEGSDTQWSRKQAELFLATQACLLENDEKKALAPHELQEKLSRILKANPELAEAHYLAFLNYLRVDEFCHSIYTLFHCFDRKATMELKSYCDEKSKEHRFAALNLATLYYHFGYTNEALAALKEAIKIAHDANDNLCLQHALSWLHHLTNSDKYQTLCLSTSKSIKSNFNFFASLSLQNMAFCATLSGLYPPDVIMEMLAKSDTFNSQYSYKDLMFNTNSMRAALWRLHGKTEMNSLWSQTLLFLNVDTKFHKTYYGEGYLQSICNTALNMLLEGNYSLVNALLHYAKSRYPNGKLSKTWLLVGCVAIFTKALYNEKWPEAESAAQKIFVFDKWEGYLHLAELYFYQQEYEEATKCLNCIIQNYDRKELLNDGKFCAIRAKLLLAQIEFASSYPNVSKTLVSLNNCVVEAENGNLSYQIALAKLHIAHALLHLDLPTQALSVLNDSKCMLEILSNGGCYDRSRATLLYAKCLIAESAKLNPKDRPSVLVNVAQRLNDVIEDFKKVEAFSRAKDALYLQARLYNIVNMIEERNKSSLEYKLLNEEYPTKNIMTLIKYL